MLQVNATGYAAAQNNFQNCPDDWSLMTEVLKFVVEHRMYVSKLKTCFNIKCTCILGYNFNVKRVMR